MTMAMTVLGDVVHAHRGCRLVANASRSQLAPVNASCDALTADAGRTWIPFRTTALTLYERPLQPNSAWHARVV